MCLWPWPEADMEEYKKSQEFLDPEIAEKLIAALCRQEMKEHRGAVKAGRWKPLR